MAAFDGVVDIAADDHHRTDFSGAQGRTLGLGTQQPVRARFVRPDIPRILDENNQCVAMPKGRLERRLRLPNMQRR